MLAVGLERDGILSLSSEQFKDVEEEEEISIGTESTTLTTDDEGDKEDTEIVILHKDEEQDEYFVPGLDDQEDIYTATLTRPGYKRMNLKGESESDKDLIIYSLNESLQIHKEMVERVQTEKDDIEYQYELDKTEETKAMTKERTKVESEQKTATDKVKQLESMYQALQKELESKSLDYQRMENRFHAHVKEAPQGQQMTVYAQITQLSQRISQVCAPLSTTATATTLDYFFEQWPDMMNHYFENEELTSSTIALLTEKFIWGLVLQVLNTPLHPGVALNQGFGEIHHWVKKRNVSWAARIRQQLCAFLVKQSSDEAGAIEEQKQSLIQNGGDMLCTLYPILSQSEKETLRSDWTDIVEETFTLNIAIKCQDNPPIEIGSIEEGELFDDARMQAYNEGDMIAFVISPPFMVDPIIPAKVYCV